MFGAGRGGEELQSTGSELNGLWDILSLRRPLPLRFALHPSRRPNGALCPCLEVDLPAFGPTPLRESASAYKGQIYTVTRILDPEHKVPFVSLSPILLAAGLSTVQGLLKMSLVPGVDYDLSLAGLEPWDDIWASLRLATKFAKELGIYHRLSALLDPRTKFAWSLDEGDRGLSHNWRVPAEFLDPATYSTESLLSAPGFAKIDILPDGEQLTTLVSARQRQQTTTRRTQPDFNLREKLIRWSTMCYAAYYDVKSALVKLVDQQHSASRDNEEGETANLALAQGVIQDINVHSISPTLQDMQEWLQISVAANTVSGHADVTELANLTPVQQAHLKSLGADTSSEAVEQRYLMDERSCQKLLEDMHLQLRAKLGSLHRMQLFNRTDSCHFAPDKLYQAMEAEENTGTALPPSSQSTPDPYQHLLDSIGQVVKRSIREHSTAQTSQIEGKGVEQRIELLHQKLDDLCKLVQQTTLP